MTIIIIGNGPGGFYAAQRLRKNDPELKIQIFDKCPEFFYTKIRLPEFISGSLPKEKLYLASAQTYADLDIELHLGEEVLAIKTEEKQIRTDKGLYAYDKCILAVGAAPYVPPIKGCDLPYVYTLRTIDDAENLKKDLAFAKTAAVIGGGLLGLEAAHALNVLGLKVSVIEYFPQLLPRHLGEDSSGKVKKKLNEMGIDIYLGRLTEEIGHHVVITDKDEEPIPADVVLLNTGIRSETHLGVHSGLDADKGILTDHRQQTSAEDVYAVGDCAEGDGGIPGLWMAAKAQGEALADILTGKRDSYDFPEFRPFLKIPGMKPGDY